MVKGEHLRPLLGFAAVASAAALILGTQLTATVEEIVAGPAPATTPQASGDLVLGQTLQAAPAAPSRAARIRTVTPAQASDQRAELVLSSFAPASAAAATQAAPAVALAPTHVSRPRAAQHAASATSSATAAPVTTPAPGAPTAGAPAPVPTTPTIPTTPTGPTGPTGPTTRPGVVTLTALLPGAGHGVGPGRSARDQAGPTGQHGTGHVYGHAYGHSGHTTYAVQPTRPHRPGRTVHADPVSLPTPSDQPHGHAYGHGTGHDNGHSGPGGHTHGQPGRTDHPGPGAGQRTRGRAHGH